MIELRQSWPMPNKAMPIVIFGAGSIVKDAHLPAYNNSGFEVIGIYDPNLDKAKELAAKYNINAFASLRKP